MKSRCTQADIARALGVSQAAVCLAVGNARSARRSRLSNEVCQKIRAKALEMGYRPTKTARILRTGRTTSITILNFGGFSEPNSQRTYETGRLANEAGFNFDVIDAYWHHDDIDRVVEGILDSRPLAVIATGAQQVEFPTERLIRAGIHVVGNGISLPGCPWIRYEARVAIREITETMIAAGRRRLALLVKDTDKANPSWQLQERRQGFLDAVTAAGATVREYHVGATDFGFSENHDGVDAIIITPPSHSPSFQDAQVGHDLTMSLLAARVPPDMLVCSNDAFAIGAMSVCCRKPLRIPADVALSGFDNLALSAHGVVPLTTVEQPTVEMCKAAIRIIQEKIRKPAALSLHNEEYVFPCHIIWRDSTPR